MSIFTFSHQYIIIVLIVFLLCFFAYRHVLPPSSLLCEGEEEVTDSVVVEIGGEVNVPGIYSFPSGVAVSELLARAGGIRSTMGLKDSDLSLVVPHGAKVIVEGKPPLVTIGAMEANKRLLFGIPLNVNRASAEDLIEVPGIGEKTAQAIIEYREKHGAFVHLDDLKKVRGIGPANYRRIKEYLALEG